MFASNNLVWQQCKWLVQLSQQYKTVVKYKGMNRKNMVRPLQYSAIIAYDWKDCRKPSKETYHKLHRHHQGNKSPAPQEESIAPLYDLINSGFADLLPILADIPWNFPVFVAVKYRNFGYKKYSTINTFIISHIQKVYENSDEGSEIRKWRQNWTMN